MDYHSNTFWYLSTLKYHFTSPKYYFNSFNKSFPSSPFLLLPFLLNFLSTGDYTWHICRKSSSAHQQIVFAIGKSMPCLRHSCQQDIVPRSGPHSPTLHLLQEHHQPACLTNSCDRTSVIHWSWTHMDMSCNTSDCSHLHSAPQATCSSSMGKKKAWQDRGSTTNGATVAGCDGHRQLSLVCVQDFS